MSTSFDSSCINSTCLVQSTRKKNCLNVSKSDLQSNSRDANQTVCKLSPSSDLRDCMGQLTQESKRKRSISRSSTRDGGIDIDAELSTGKRYPGSVSVAEKDEIFNHAKLRKGEGQVCKEASIKSMVLQSENLAREIFSAYEKERQTVVQERAEIAAELVQLRVGSEAAAMETAFLRLHNQELAEKEAATAARLVELQTACKQRDVVIIVAAMVMAKSLMLSETAEITATANLEMEKVKFANAELLKDRAIVEATQASVIETLRASLTVADNDLSQLRSERAKLLQETRESETMTTMETDKLRFSLAAANTEVKQVHARLDAAVRELTNVHTVTGLEIDKLLAEKSVMESKVVKLNGWLMTLRAEMAKRDAQASAEMTSLRREKAESEAKEAAALDKLNSIAPNACSKMHLAFLINCGLLPPEALVAQL